MAEHRKCCMFCKYGSTIPEWENSGMLQAYQHYCRKKKYDLDFDEWRVNCRCSKYTEVTRE